jgi:hypothetical protein
MLSELIASLHKIKKSIVELIIRPIQSNYSTNYPGTNQMKSIKVLALIVGAISLVPAVSFAANITSNTSAVKPQLVAQRYSVPVFSQSVAIAETALGNALGVAQSQAIGGPGKSALAKSIAKSVSLLGNATALSGSTAIGNRGAVATSLAQAETVLGDALAIAQSDAISGPGKPAIAKSLASAKTSVGNATAIAKSTAR